MPISAFALFFIGCSSPSIIEGTVTDIWGNPIPNAPISKISNIYSADKTTDENGEFEFLSYNGEHSIFVDPEGYVPQEITFEHLSKDNIGPEHLDIQLYPVPPNRGIFAIGEESYLELDEMISTKVGTDVKALQGIQDIGGTNLAKEDTIEFVFYIGQGMILEQILQMKLQLHEMMFVNKGEKFLTIKGYVTPFIGLWVTKDYNQEKYFEAERLPGADFLDVEILKVRATDLEEGQYAFHVYDALSPIHLGNSRNKTIPDELRTAYPFKVKEDRSTSLPR